MVAQFCCKTNKLIYDIITIIFKAEGMIFMNKEVFELLEKYSKLENKLYFKLTEEKGMDEDEANKLLEGFTDFYEKNLKIGKYLDKDSYVGTETYLVKAYEDFESYLRVTIIYLFDNDFALCETTSGLIKLIPKQYLFEC